MKNNIGYILLFILLILVIILTFININNKDTEISITNQNDNIFIYYENGKASSMPYEDIIYSILYDKNILDSDEWKSLELSKLIEVNQILLSMHNDLRDTAIYFINYELNNPEFITDDMISDKVKELISTMKFDYYFNSKTNITSQSLLIPNTKGSSYMVEFNWYGDVFYTVTYMGD